jgi:hypothetical protein
MNNIHPFFKIVAAVCFVLLISGFVAYRSGAFENQTISQTLQVNGSEELSAFSESVAPGDSTKKKSKKNHSKSKNSGYHANPSNNNQANQSPRMMGSSKSGVIFTPKQDTAKKK